MKLNSNIQTVYNLFNNSQEQFIIPPYQRRYSWKVEHLRALFDDINLISNTEGHLFGMIIFHDLGKNSAGLELRELVDGQQRLTTLTILLRSLQKAFIRKNSITQANQIERILFLYNDDGITVNKLQLDSLDQSDYDYIISPDRNNLHSFQNLNLKNAIECFDNWVFSFGLDELKKFYEKVSKVAVVLRLDITNASDAYKLFETINNRGLKLSSTDIIKNFLFGHAANFDQRTLNEIKNTWRSIIISLDGINTDNFFRQYMCALLKRKVTYEGLLDLFKSYYIENVLGAEYLLTLQANLGKNLISEEEQELEIEEDNTDEQNKEVLKTEITEKTSGKIKITEFLAEIHHAAVMYNQIYYRLFNDPIINNHLFNLSRIQCVPSFIFLTHFLRKDYSQATKISVLNIIETLMLRRHICGSKTGENDSIFAQLMYALDESTEQKMIHKLKIILKEKSSIYPSDEDFLRQFPSFNFKGKVEDRAIYILEKLEICKKNERGQTMTSFTNTRLEYIIPKSIRNINNSDWVNYLGADDLNIHSNYFDRIGNLTLIEDDIAMLNTNANNPFITKKRAYLATNLDVTMEIVNEYDNFKIQQITQRGSEIAKLALKLWKID